MRPLRIPGFLLLGAGLALWLTVDLARAQLPAYTKTQRGVRVGMLNSINDQVNNGDGTKSWEALRDQMADSTFFNISSVLVYTDESSLQTGMASGLVDVVVIIYGQIRHNFYPNNGSLTVATLNAVQQFVEGGGGLVWGAYGGSICDQSLPAGQSCNNYDGQMDGHQALMPIKMDKNKTPAARSGLCRDTSAIPGVQYTMRFDTSKEAAWRMPPSIAISGGTIHYSVDGVLTESEANALGLSNITSVGTWEIVPEYQTSEDGCSPVGKPPYTSNMQGQGYVTAQRGSGRIAWLSQPYAGSGFLDNAQALRINFPDRILELAVWWTSGIPRDCDCVNGNCVPPSTVCNCSSGWSGSRCTIFSCDPGFCKNDALCVGPNQCDCFVNVSGGTSAYDKYFTGDDCGERFCSPECQNGGTCEPDNFCNCSTTTPSPGFVGSACNFPVCPQICFFGTCTSPGVCTCANSSRYTGPSCDQPVCADPCQNGGTCTAPQFCTCDPVGPGGGLGYHWGDLCQNNWCFPSCNPSNEVGCVTNTSVPGANKPTYCDCSLAPGGAGAYTGDTCYTPICNPACENGSPCVAPNTCDCSSISVPGNFSYSGPTCSILAVTTGTTAIAPTQTTTGYIPPVITYNTLAPSGGGNRTGGTTGKREEATTGEETGAGTVIKGEAAPGLTYDVILFTSIAAVGVCCCVFLCMVCLGGNGRDKKGADFDDWEVEMSNGGSYA